ncbi:MAG TPA: DUF5684 domain-containing protein [Candidatus Dojkabacteria bacterium]|nr:DUF5684 domain-containing protein [Candidatus Dojkabacteria bacterium]
MFKKLATILTVLVVTLVLPLGVVHAQDTSTSNDYQYLYSTQDTSGSTDTSTTTSAEDAAAAAVGLLFGGVFLVVGLVFALVGYIYSGLTLMATAQKLNVPNAWLAWIPLANLYLMTQCAGLSPWTMLLILVPFVNFIYAVYVYMKISERRGFNQLLGLLILVPVANLIWMGVLAWGKPSAATAA